MSNFKYTCQGLADRNAFREYSGGPKYLEGASMRDSWKLSFLSWEKDFRGTR